MKTYYVTKYWATKGIVLVDDTQARPDADGKYLSSYEVPRDLKDLPSYTHLFFSKRDWFETMEEAVEDVKARAQRKLKAMDRQLKKIREAAEGNVKSSPFPHGEKD